LITTAYRTLTDETQKESYDDSLRQLAGHGSVDEETEEDCLVDRTSSWESSCAPKGTKGVFVDESECVMCVRCVECAPNTFVMDADGSGRARVTQQYADSVEDVDWAVVSCPVGAISYHPHDELTLLEHMMASCDFDGVVWSSQLDYDIASFEGFGPFDYLQRFRNGQPLPKRMRKLLGIDSPKGHFAWRPSGAARQNLEASQELGEEIEQAASTVPKEVRCLAWPSPKEHTAQ
jgi:ferredoxin